MNLPHVTQFDEADITDLEELRGKLKTKATEQGVKLTPLAFIIRACVRALHHFPTFNSSLDANGENLVLKKYVHMGFAADTPNGLMVPVVRDADRKDIYEVARALGELSEKARTGTLERHADAGRLPSRFPAWAASAAPPSRPSSMRRKWRSWACRARA